MDILASYLSKVEKEITNLSFPSVPSNLYKPLSYFMAIGGKRIRPILTLMSAEIFGNQSQKALDVGLGIELFHNFTLLHDDIMDNAPLRRNFKTVHEKWNANTAILSGDTLFVKAMEYVLKGQSDRLNSLFLTTACEVCEGQQMDMDFEKRVDVSIAEYLEMIRLKTSVLLGCALQAGAIVANVNEEEQERLYQIGLHIGLGFQLQDDHLDTFGKSGNVGKTIGGDILSNKKTFLYLKAQELASPEQKESFEELLKAEHSQRKIDQTIALYNALDIPTISQEKVDYYFQKGIAYLDEINVSEERKQPLRTLIDFLYQRNY